MILTSLIGPILIIIPLEKLLKKKQYIKNEMLLISIYILTYTFFANSLILYSLGCPRLIGF